jgi:putative hydrolase of the HAD superfamily
LSGAAGSIQAVLFDLDGTLHDRAATIQMYLAGHLERFPAESGYAERFTVLDDFGYVHKRTVFARLVQEFSLPHAPEALYQDFLNHAWAAPVLMPGACEVLGALRAAGIRTDVVSKGQTDKQRLCLHRLDLTRRLDTVLISEETGLAKPDPRIYITALERLGIPASQTLFVGDSPVNDIQGPQRAGLWAAYLPTSHPLLSDIQPEFILNHLNDVLRIVLHASQPAVD